MNMDSASFQNKVLEMAEKKPRLFALESDAKADSGEIEDIETYYNIILPDSYKDFVSQYGGGYFGFIAVYSCDCDGMFFIKDKV